MDIANWQLGKYVSYAIAEAFREKGKPSVYPKNPFQIEAQKSTLKRKFTDEEIEAYLKGEKPDV